MKRFKFEIQNCVNIFINAEDKIEARRNIIENLSEFADELIIGCYVSDGEEVKK